jgi:protein O-mannosyl-transferase
LRSGGDEQAKGSSEARSIEPAERAASPLRPGPNGVAGFLNAPWNREWLFGLVLIAATVVAYLPALHGGFVWDDYANISDSRTLRSWKGLWEIWFKPGATFQYYPLTYTGFWVGYHLWGLNTLGYHLVNVLLHGVAAVLLWQVLRRLKVRGAWLAGAIFALHPVNVMSVAWMTELKNTLSGALALAAAWAYVRFARLGVYATEQGSGAAKGNVLGSDWRYYILVLALFQLAMFAKTAVSFLPVTLLLVAWWQRERMGWRDVAPLLPMLGIALVMGQVTFYVERLHGATGEQIHISLLDRVLISGRSFWFYLGKLFYPHRLTPVYERWHMDARAWWQYMYPAATLGALGGLWWMRRRIGKGPLAALLHFYVSTSLLILIVVLTFTRFSFVSDHWQYFGCMSVITLAAVGITKALDFVQPSKRFIKPTLCGALVVLLGVLTWRQSGLYADSETLWRANLARNPNSDLGNNGFGNALFQKGQVDEAITHYRKALEIQPGYTEALNNLGNALLQKGQLDEAIAQFQRVLEIQPGFAKAHYNLGTAFLRKGQLDGAIAHYQRALEIQPDYAEAHFNLGSAHLQKGQLDEALAHFRKAIALRPELPGIYYNLGLVLLRKGQVDEAIAQFQKAVESQPDFSDARNSLAWVLATSPQASVRNGARAVELAQQAERLSEGRNPMILGTLAAAYAEAGRFPEAIATAQRAAQLATAQSNSALLNILRVQMELYQASRPYRDTYPTNAPASGDKP